MLGRKQKSLLCRSVLFGKKVMTGTPLVTSKHVINLLDDACTRKNWKRTQHLHLSRNFDNPGFAGFISVPQRGGGPQFHILHKYDVTLNDVRLENILVQR